MLARLSLFVCMCAMFTLHTFFQHEILSPYFSRLFLSIVKLWKKSMEFHKNVLKISLPFQSSILLKWNAGGSEPSNQNPTLVNF